MISLFTTSAKQFLPVWLLLLFLFILYIFLAVALCSSHLLCKIYNNNINKKCVRRHKVTESDPNLVRYLYILQERSKLLSNSQFQDDISCWVFTLYVFMFWMCVCVSLLVNASALRFYNASTSLELNFWMVKGLKFSVFALCACLRSKQKKILKQKLWYRFYSAEGELNSFTV